MESMTGHGTGQAIGPDLRCTVEARSVNHRGCAVQVHAPPAWHLAIPRLEETVRAQFARGAFTLRVEIEGGSEGATVFPQQAFARRLALFREAARQVGAPAEPDPRTLYQMVSEAERESPAAPGDAFPAALASALGNALAELAASRRAEGARLRADLEERLGRLATLTGEAAALAPDRLDRYRDHLHERLRRAGLQLELDDERVLREIALFAERCDFTEELVRLDSHLGAARELLAGEGPAGRKLEFLLQEMHREVQTLGSKANDTGLSTRVIEAKQLLEQLREQAANLA